MSNIDKSQSIINFLQTCPVIQNNPLFFNFGTIEDGATQATISSDERTLNKSFIDGSILKRYTFILDNFRSVAYNPVVANMSDENVDDFTVVQSLLDWINTQNDISIFPDFGEDCIIEKMETLTDKPKLVGVDTTLNPPMAVYRIAIQIDYIDTTKKIWN